MHPSVHPESGTLLPIEGIKQDLERAQQDQPKTQRTFGSRKFQERERDGEKGGWNPGSHLPPRSRRVVQAAKGKIQARLGSYLHTWVRMREARDSILQ